MESKKITVTEGGRLLEVTINESFIVLTFENNIYWHYKIFISSFVVGKSLRWDVIPVCFQFSIGGTVIPHVINFIAFR